MDEEFVQYMEYCPRCAAIKFGRSSFNEKSLIMEMTKKHFVLT